MSSSSSSSPSSKKQENIVWKRFLAGTCSGAALVVVGHPLDTLKVLMQTTQSNVGFGKVTLELARKDGIKGFYRGMSTPLALTGFVNTLLWGMQFNLVEILSQTPQHPQTIEVMQAAIVSGALITIVVTPMELIKSRLQVRVDTATNTPLQVVSSIYEQHGLRGLYRGWLGVVLARASNWAYFGGYAFFSHQISTTFPTSSSRMRAICAGGLAGCTYWLAAFPFDVIKARMMASSPHSGGFLTTTRNLYREHGLAGFTKGFLPCVLRAFPANAAAFLGFETAMGVLSKY